MKFSISDTLVVLGSVAFISTFSLLLYQDLTYKRQVNAEEVIGKIIFKHNRATRKYFSTVVWEELDQESPVVNKDTIHTDAGAEAVVVLNDNTRIEIGENSMIYLDFSDKNVNIKFAFGSMRAKAGQKGTGNAVTIESGDTKVAASDADVKLSTGDGTGLAVSVEKGTANVDSQGQIQEVSDNERAVVQGDKLTVSKVTLNPISPPDAEYIFSFDPKVSVPFRWSRSGGQGQNNQVQIEVSRSQNFSQLLYNRSVGDERITLDVPEGIFYWRLSATESDNSKTYSSLHKFTVIRDEKLQLMVPVPEARVGYFERKPIINFAWKKNKLANGYQLQVASDANFQQIVHQRSTVSSSIALDILEPGSYFWRVKAGNNLQNWPEQTSETRALTVFKRQSIVAPRPLNPEENKRIGQALVSQKGIIYSWTASSEIREYQFVLSRDNQFSSKISDMRLASNYHSSMTNLGPGRYYWRVKGYYGESQQTPFSQTVSFLVVAKEELNLIKPDQGLQLPTYALEQEGITFSWSRLQSVGKYQLQFSRNSSFNSISKSHKLGDNIIKLKSISNGNDQGQYYWRVRFLDDQQQPILTSTARTFNLQRALNKPILLYPSNHSIDLAQQKEITFRWQNIPQADVYELKVMQVSSGVLEEKLSIRVRQNSYTLRQFANFNVGNFQWRLTAIQLENGREISSSPESRMDFSIIYSRIDKPPVVNLPGVFYINP